MKKSILYIVVILALAGVGVGGYFAYQAYVALTETSDDVAQKIETSAPDFTVKAEALIAEFDQDGAKANGKYNNKIVQFTGTLSKVEPADTTLSLVFDYGTKNIIAAQVLPKYKNEMQALNPGTILTVKGQYNGIIPGDELFDVPGSILLNKCSPVK